MQLLSCNQDLAVVCFLCQSVALAQMLLLLWLDARLSENLPLAAQCLNLCLAIEVDLRVNSSFRSFTFVEKVRP